MFGGSGKVLDTGRELTGIEKALMNRIVQVVFQELEDAWKRVVPISIKQMSLETNPQFVQIVPPGETVIVISFQLKLLQSTGLMTICYPYVALESIMDKLSVQNWIDATKRRSKDQDAEINKNNLLLLKTPVKAVLAQTEVKIREFLDLQVGDVVTSQHKISQDVKIYVKDKLKFRGSPGLVGKKRGFIVTGKAIDK
jgi:flagellar motor switch protein FliM